MQEAKDSSEIENIVATHDELFKDDVLPEAFANPAAENCCDTAKPCRSGSSRCEPALGKVLQQPAGANQNDIKTPVWL